MRFVLTILALLYLVRSLFAVGKVQVYILAGQSNMQGQGVVDLDHPEYYNGGKGILNNVMKNPEMAARYAHIKDEHGELCHP